MAARAFRILGFWHQADEPPTRGSGGGGPGVGRVELRRTLGPQMPPRVIFPAQLMLAQPERGGR